MFIDYHTHHERCGHAEGSLEDYIQRGIELGVEQLGLSDHMPLIHVDPDSYYEGMAMAVDELPHYVEECFELREKYAGQIDIRIGLEGDYIEGHEWEIEKMVKAYPWDYVIGSVHFLEEWDITDHRQLHGWEGRRVETVYEQYYDAVEKAIHTGFYDFIGHIDVIKRFGYQPQDSNWPRALERRVLDAVRSSDAAIELNASGLRMPAAEMFPSRHMLEYAHALNIPVTLGSDAHQPARLAQYLDEAKALLKDVGYTQLATFKNRQRTLVPFEIE